MTPTLRVVWLLKTFGLGGAERLLLELAPRMPSVEYFPLAVMDEPRDIVPALREAGFEPMRLGASSNVDVRWVCRLRHFLREVSPDILHVHNPYAAAILRVAGLGVRIPMVYTEHNVWRAYHPLSRWGNALTFPLARHSIAVSDAVQSSIAGGRLGRMTLKRLTLIRNGVDFEAVVREADRETLELPLPCLGTVANLRPEKGIDVLLAAFRLLRPRFPRHHCVVVGGGPLESQIRTQALASSGVLVTGVRHDARALMKRFDVFVLPSRAEGLPLALLEAMALGRPVVATAVGGIPEVVESGENGMLIPPDRPGEMADAIIRLLADPTFAARMGNAASVTIRNHWSIDATARAYADVYERAMQLRGS
jgi:glycosyltransferase involved in cell wall biosynthesis